MKNKLVMVPSIKEPIRPSPGFIKKGLSDYKLDIVGLCGFGCRYCSSNCGNYLRINRERFADETERQLGRRLYPADDPSLMFVWEGVLDRLRAQIDSKGPRWGDGKVLVFSMLTDGFSPYLVETGATEAALRLVLKGTRFRIRVLTKNAAVGSPRWIQFFRRHPDRFVVGLSIGTLDDDWARRVELGTPPPSMRIKALHDLQDAGVPTYGMLCPVFPDVVEGVGALDSLVGALRPEVVEDVWAEPYNDRVNWRAVRDGYQRKSVGYGWMTRVYERHDSSEWSRYATELYVRLRDRALGEGWIGKLRYMLYERRITADDAKRLRGLAGLSLQGEADKGTGLSRNAHVAAVQREMKGIRAADDSAAKRGPRVVIPTAAARRRNPPKTIGGLDLEQIRQVVRALEAISDRPLRRAVREALADRYGVPPNTIDWCQAHRTASLRRGADWPFAKMGA